MEMIPDVPNEVKRRFYELGKGYDFVVVEIGGTTGDIENLPFLYAAREVRREKEALYVMVSYIPFLKNVGELKTKPTQHAIAELRATGINPDILITRSEIPVDEPRLETLGRRCFLEREAIFDDPDEGSIYSVPLVLEKQEILKRIFKHFKIKNRKPNLTEWKKFVRRATESKKEVKIALVGKYVKNGASNHKDVYVSVLEALRHAAAANGVSLKVEAIEASDLNVSELKKGNYKGLVVPQGWGGRGVEGKIAAIKYARENKIPYLGLCFGMQMAVIEYARDVLGLKDANSVEADEKTKNPVIHLMPNQKEYLDKHQYGGTIRLGAWPCKIKKGTLLSKIYGEDEVSERHRHRYEVNNEYREQLEKAGMIISGTSPDGELVEAIELANHPFFVGTQFHPEYKSRPLAPHPIFIEFVKAAVKNR